MVSSTPRPHFTHGKDPVPILQEAGWALGQVWTCGKSRPHRDSIPDRPVRSQSLYRLSYRAHVNLNYAQFMSMGKEVCVKKERLLMYIQTNMYVCACVRACWKIDVYNVIITMPLQAWVGPECSRSLRLPYLKTLGT